MRSPKASELTHNWHLIDAKDNVLGRMSTQIALLLMGKAKSDFVRNLDSGDYVVVVNAKEVKVTGKKEDKKLYQRHSGYPGGFKEETLRELRARKPEEIIIHSVKGMLPHNKLRDKMLKRLFIFEGAQHTYQEKFGNQKSEPKTEEVVA